MAIFSRDNSTELPAESQVEYPSRSGRRWPVLVVYIIAALLVATAVVFAGRWVYHQATKSDNSSNVATNSAANRDKAPPPPRGTTTAPQPSTPKKTTPTPGALPNNGPGEVVALFITSSLAVGALHYIVQLRKA